MLKLADFTNRAADMLGQRDKYGLTLAHYLVCFDKIYNLAGVVYRHFLDITQGIEDKKQKKELFLAVVKAAMFTYSAPTPEMYVVGRESDHSLIATASDLSRLLERDLGPLLNPQDLPNNPTPLTRSHAVLNDSGTCVILCVF
jgi:hypothetical protein